MEPKGSLPHSLEPTICPYSEPCKSSPCPSYFFELHFNSILPLKKTKFWNFVQSNHIPNNYIQCHLYWPKPYFSANHQDWALKCLISAHFIITEYTFLCKLCICSLFNDAAWSSTVTFTLLQFWGIYKWQTGSYINLCFCLMYPPESQQSISKIW
jgi:hypothetical protein